MDREECDNIFNYLVAKIYPGKCTKNDKRRLREKAGSFLVTSGELFHKSNPTAAWRSGRRAFLVSGNSENNGPFLVSESKPAEQTSTCPIASCQGVAYISPMGNWLGWPTKGDCWWTKVHYCRNRICLESGKVVAFPSSKKLNAAENHGIL